MPPADHPLDARTWLANRATTDPAEEPITVAQAKAHSRIDDNEEEGEIALKIKEARDYIEGLLGRPLVKRTFRLTRNGFPAGRYFLLPSARAVSISSITYIDAAGATQTLSGASYGLEGDPIPARVRLARGVTAWPATYASDDDQEPTVTVTYLAGWDTAASLPPSIIAAVKLAFGHLWDGTREAAGENPLEEHAHSITALCARHVVAGLW